MNLNKSLIVLLASVLIPFSVQAEEIADAPSPKPMSEDSLNYLLSEDMYQGSLFWQGNKASTKFNYDKLKKK